MDKSLYLDHLNLLPIPGEAFFYPGFFDERESGEHFSRLTDNVDWKQEPMTIFGKMILQPRFTAFYGDEGLNYSFLGVNRKTLPWTTELVSIKEAIEKKFDVQFNSCLLNHYRSGADSLGWHRDNDKSLGPYPFVASVSFGAPRLFQFRHYKEKIPIISVELTDGSLLITKSDTQHLWEHRLPKTVVPTQPRISLTFRHILK